MAKKEEFKIQEPDYSEVKLHDVSIQDLVAYKKIADAMFEHYDSWAKSFLGEYDPITKSNYDTAIEQANYFRMIREAVRSEMESRLLKLDQAVLIWEDNFAKNGHGDEETVD